MTGPDPSPMLQDRSKALAPQPEEAGPRAGSSRIPRGLLVGLWLLLAAVHLLMGPEQRRSIWPLAYLLLEGLAGASLAYRACHTSSEERLAWWLLAASALLEVPNLLLPYLHLRGHLLPWAPGLSSYLTLISGVLVVGGVLSFPKGPEGGARFLRRVLESLVFAASLLFLLWVMGIQGSLRVAAQGVGLRVFAAYLNVALLGGGLVFMTSYHPDRSRGPLGWLAASALAWLVGISFWTLAGLPSVVATQPWILIAGAIPMFQGLAAWSPRTVAEAMGGAPPERTLTRLFPYLPVLVAVGAMAALLAWAPQHVTRSAYALFLVMVVLILLQQFQAILDLQAARRTLEARVQQRTEALTQAQDTLLRTERMNTVALMGAGLAHDLNNLLGAVKSSAELAVMQLESGVVPGARELTRIATAADRAALLTRRLMGFARREGEELAPLDLAREVREMEVTFRLLLPHTVDLHLEFPDGEVLLVQSSRLRLEQMLVNLVANAGDAMPGGGTLRIRVAPVGTETDQAMIEVADSGSGMTADTLERIFDPFFTTKAPGKGTGLGLPSLKAMVKEGGGRMEVESEPGRGSRFRILLPRLPGDALNPR